MAVVKGGELVRIVGIGEYDAYKEDEEILVGLTGWFSKDQPIDAEGYTGGSFQFESFVFPNTMSGVAIGAEKAHFYQIEVARV